jgi:exoribonuclease-2
MVESEAKKRWLLQYLKQSWGDEPIEALVLMAVKGGYKVEMLPWAVEAFLNTDKELALGETVDTVIEKIRVKASNTRLRLQ